MSDYTPAIVGGQVAITPENAPFFELDAHPRTIDKSCGQRTQGGLVGRRLPNAADGGTQPPPFDNMGVEITNSSELVENSAKIDWLSFTIPLTDDSSTMGIVADYSSFLGGAIPLDYGRYFYSHSRAVLESGRIFWNPERAEMGIHIELPASALAALVSIHGPDESPIYDLICKALGDRALFKRLDVAADSYTIPMSTILTADDNGYLVTRSRTVQETKNRRGPGSTLYIGSKNSNRLVRFYDKAAQQGLSNEMIWTRAEVQLRNEMAHQAVMLIMSDGEDMESIISSAVDFRYDDDSNTSRRTRVEWWQEWLGCYKRLRFVVSKLVCTLEKSQAWVTNSVATTLAFIVKALGAEAAVMFFERSIDEGFANLSPAKRSWLVAHGKL